MGTNSSISAVRGSNSPSGSTVRGLRSRLLLVQSHPQATSTQTIEWQQTYIRTYSCVSAVRGSKTSAGNAVRGLALSPLSMRPERQRKKPFVETNREGIARITTVTPHLQALQSCQRGKQGLWQSVDILGEMQAPAHSRSRRPDDSSTSHPSPPLLPPSFMHHTLHLQRRQARTGRVDAVSTKRRGFEKAYVEPVQARCTHTWSSVESIHPSIHPSIYPPSSLLLPLLFSSRRLTTLVPGGTPRPLRLSRSTAAAGHAPPRCATKSPALSPCLAAALLCFALTKVLFLFALFSLLFFSFLFFSCLVVAVNSRTAPHPSIHPSIHPSMAPLDTPNVVNVGFVQPLFHPEFKALVLISEQLFVPRSDSTVPAGQALSTDMTWSNSCREWRGPPLWVAYMRMYVCTYDHPRPLHPRYSSRGGASPLCFA